MHVRGRLYILAFSLKATITMWVEWAEQFVTIVCTQQTKGRSVICTICVMFVTNNFSRNGFMNVQDFYDPIVKVTLSFRFIIVLKVTPFFINT